MFLAITFLLLVYYRYLFKMQQIRAVHWNCFKLTQQRRFELEHFLNLIKPDILSIQEIELSKEEANLCLNFQEYSAYIRTRESNPKKGDGVAILIRSGIPHAPIFRQDDRLEII
jgi:exonuclease III